MPIVKSLLLILGLLLISVIGLGVMVLDTTAVLERVTVREAAKLGDMQFLSAENDPRRLTAGETGRLVLGQEDLDLLLAYACNYLDEGASQLRLTGDQADLQISLRLPGKYLPLYLNVATTLVDAEGWPRITKLRLGSLPIPRWLHALVLKKGKTLLIAQYPELQELLDAVKDVSLQDSQLLVRYEWDPQLVMQLTRRGSQWLLPEDMHERLTLYADRVADLSRQYAAQRRVSASTFLAPLFAYAMERGGDPVAENQALLLVLSLYALQVDPGQLLNQAAAEAPGPEPRELQFYRRTDLARHFFTAIGLTLSGDAGLASNIGVLKELEDARGSGSGFSFTDIGADRAGMRFAEFAVASAASARLLQERMVAVGSEAEYFPDFRQLPEFLTNVEFEAGYGGENSPAFAQEIAKIDLLISTLAIFEP